MKYKFSDAMRQIDISKYKMTGNLKADAELFAHEKDWGPCEVNYVALRMSFGKIITVHTLTDGVAGKVNNTVICNMPREIPHFLTKPFIIEARHDNVLFADVVSISGYLCEGELFLISILADDGCIIQHELKSYDGRSLDEINFLEFGSSGKYSREDLRRTDTMAFVTVFALMMEAERTPISVDTTREYHLRKGEKIPSNNFKSDWIEKRVYIDKKVLSKNQNLYHREIDKDGLILKDVYIHGFLRLQPYGPDHRLRKWIYVDGFDSSRWAKEGHTRYIVDTYHQR
jgi:hypothetical protein